METPEQSGSGYPEEAPAEVVDDEGTPQERTGGESRSDPEDSDPDKATGNPNAAGG